MSLIDRFLLSFIYLFSCFGCFTNQKQENDLCEEPTIQREEGEEGGCISFDFGTKAIFERNHVSILVNHSFGGDCRVYSSGDICFEWTRESETSFLGYALFPQGDAQTTITFISKGEETNKNLYSSETVDGRYAISVFSLDDARMLAGNLDNQVLMDGDPVSPPCLEKASENNNFQKLNNRGWDLFSGNVSGTVFWSDDNNHTYPLVNATVKLTFRNNAIALSAQTNNSGYYSIDYTNIAGLASSFVIDVHIYLYNSLVRVVNGNVLYESVSVLNPFSGGTTFSPVFSTADGFGRAACIFAGATAFANHAYSLSGGSLNSQCTFSYPENNGFNYDRFTRTVRINSQYDLYSTGGPSSYLAWDVIGHEYGHHLQNVFGFSYGYVATHYSGNSDIEQAFIDNPSITDFDAKKQGLGVAWSEAWPTFFSIVAQQSFPSYLNELPFLKDKNYTSHRGQGEPINYSLDAGNVLKGDGCERTIMAFLYKLWDSDNLSSYDNISVSEQSLWQLIVNSSPEFFYSFVSYLYDSSLSFDRNDLGFLLEGLHLSASNIRASSVSHNYANLPLFSWTGNGYSFSFNGTLKLFNNDMFNLRFYDEDKHFLFERIVYGGSVALNQTEWNQILCSAGSNYYITIESYDTLGFQSGPYYSGFHRFSKPASASYSAPLNTLEAKRYYERELAIAPGTQWTVTLNFPTSGLKAIQTFSNKDTELYLYNSNGTVLIDYDDDSGFSRNAYLVLDATAGVDYKLKVNFYNSQIGGMVKLSVTPFDGALGNNQTDFSAVNHFVDINTYPNFIWGSYLTLNNSEIITWTPPGVGNYTVWLESQFDNYLYIINPNSHKPLKRNVDFNDDSNGTNASLTIDTQPGVKYLIIYSQYNPSSSFPNNNSDISVHFQKNN